MNTLRHMLTQITVKWGPFGCQTETCYLMLVSAAVKENVMDTKTFMKASLSKSKKEEKKVERKKTELIRSESSPQVVEKCGFTLGRLKKV